MTIGAILEKTYQTIAAEHIQMAKERTSVSESLEGKLSPLAVFGSESFGYHRRKEEKEWRLHADNVVESKYMVCVKQREIQKDDYLPRQTVITVVQGKISTEEGNVPFMRVTYRYASQEYLHAYWQVAYDIHPDSSISMVKPDNIAGFTPITNPKVLEEQHTLYETVAKCNDYKSAFRTALTILQKEKKFDMWLVEDTLNRSIPYQP